MQHRQLRKFDLLSPGQPKLRNRSREPGHERASVVPDNDTGVRELTHYDGTGVYERGSDYGYSDNIDDHAALFELTDTVQLV